LEKAPEANAQALADHKVHPLILNLQNRKWTDEDIVQDLEFLSNGLEKNMEQLGFLIFFFFFFFFFFLTLKN